MSRSVKANSKEQSLKDRMRRGGFINWPPTDELEQNTLADEMCNWVIKPDSWNLEDFPISKSMAPSRFYEIGDNNTYFAHSLNFARWVIASKLVTGWRKKDLEKDYCLRLLPLYNEKYREYVNEKIYHEAKGKASGNFIIHQDPIPQTKEVDEQLKKKARS